MITDETINRILNFRDSRDWAKFHTLPELARAISIEASELNECFLWGKYDINAAKEEIPDLLIFLCYYIDKEIGFSNVDALINAKLDKKEKDYPIEKCKGIATKYTEL